MVITDYYAEPVIEAQNPMLLFDLTHDAGKVKWDARFCSKILAQTSGFRFFGFEFELRFDKVSCLDGLKYEVIVQQVRQIVFGHLVDSETFQKVANMLHPVVWVVVDPVGQFNVNIDSD